MPQKTEDTPMMKQYKKIKADYEDAFLFFRLGDFYEMFYEDAEEGAQILELTLTARNKNADEPIPMCGVPYHSAEQYIDQLVEKGYKVAICEQVEDPQTAKGMVAREVVQLITPGTVMGESVLDAKENNYLTAVLHRSDRYYLAYVDLSTGELRATELTGIESVVNELAALQSREVLLEEEEEELADHLESQLAIIVSNPRSEIKENFSTYLSGRSLQEGIENVLKMLLNYLSDTQMRALDHLQPVDVYETEHFLRLGPGARKNLELQKSLKDNSKKGTLLWLLDETETAMGGRLLKQWLDKPLIDRKQIEKRQTFTANLLENFFERADLTEILSKVYDLERLAGRIAFQTVNARDLIQLKDSLNQIPLLISLLEMMNQSGVWKEILEQLDPITDVRDLIERAIVPEPPISLTEGGIIQDGFHEKLDQYLDAMRNNKQWIANLQEEEREATGIKNLKIGFNKVFGYYIEVTNANRDKVDETRYERKQTLTNSERYITPELKEKEAIILEAEEKSQALEYELFVEIRETIKREIDRLQKLAKLVSTVDVLQSFAEVSDRYQFTRPELHGDSQTIFIEEGRHPVVEKVLGDQTYVPNNVYMDDDTDILLITGPNMSGKSTYMRQLALTIIMSQMGCFVPAQETKLPVFDQIFTRIGAMDDLIGGQSTFMVEMKEANFALEKATPRSLILFDEIGRGTATYDGMALAEAIIEYIHNNIHAKTLFSTHYHELTVLEERLDKLVNVHVGAVEDEGDLVFLHKMEAGPTDKSYGVQVAKLAGLPHEVIQQANKIMKEFEKEEHNPFVKEEPASQMTLFHFDGTDNEKEILEELKGLDINSLSPMDTFKQVNDWLDRLETD